MCKKVERLTAKIGWTSCTKQTISFEVWGFHTETRLLQSDFIYFELIWTPLFFFVQNAPFKATPSIYNPFLLHLLFFMHLLIILSYKTMKLKTFEMNSEKVESWHGIIISPTQHVLKSCEGYDKNWMHFVYKMDNLFWSI